MYIVKLILVLAFLYICSQCFCQNTSMITTIKATQSLDTTLTRSQGIWYKSTRVHPGILNNQAAPKKNSPLLKIVALLFNPGIHASIAGPTASMQISESTPVFNSTLEIPPYDFVLVRLTPTASSRQLFFHRPADPDQKIILHDTLKIAFECNLIEKGLYQITPCQPLAPGQYAFLQTTGYLYAGNNYKIYDFSYHPKNDEHGPQK
jgi:hypothetical protein